MSKSKFEKFSDDEEVAIEVNDHSKVIESLNIVLRNPKNEDIKFSIDQTKIKSVLEMRKEISNKVLKLEDDKILKMFFKGRPFKDENMLSELREIPKNQDDVSILTQNLEAANEEQNRTQVNSNNRPDLLSRGFNRFRDFGVDMSEVHMLRILFHTAHIAQTRQRMENIDWSPEAVINREEEWLNSNNPSILNDTNQIRNNPLSLLILRNNSHMGAFRFPSLERHRPRSLVRDFDDFSEPDYRFFVGVFVGLLFNFFTVFILMFCILRQKMRLGMQFGMIVGVIMLCLLFMK